MLNRRDLVDENKWMQSAKFYVRQQKERRGSNLTKCILSKQPECVYQVSTVALFLVHIDLFSFSSLPVPLKALSFDILVAGHSAPVSETVQSRLSGEIQFIFSSLLLLQFYLQDHLVLRNLRGLPNLGPP